MARSPAAPPQMQISIPTAIKAGFFGAIGFFVAQLVIAPVVLLLLLTLGVSIAGLTASHLAPSSPTAATPAHTSTQTSPQTLSRWTDTAGPRAPQR